MAETTASEVEEKGLV
jgi:hypothetical protein